MAREKLIMSDKDKKTEAPAKGAEEEKKPAQGESGSGEEVEVPKKFKSLVEEIEKMSVLDLSELVKILEDKFGVSAAAPMMAAGAVAASEGEGEVVEEKSTFDVELTSTGDSKINVIKAIRGVTELGLKEAKDLADGAPKIVKEGVAKEEAEEIKKKLEEAGAQATLK